MRSCRRRNHAKKIALFSFDATRRDGAQTGKAIKTSVHGGRGRRLPRALNGLRDRGSVVTVVCCRAAGTGSAGGPSASALITELRLKRFVAW